MVSKREEEGWRQLRAGISLIQWSKLAKWDRHDLAFSATRKSSFESQEGHNQVHPEYGRLICWITFGVGSEYITKGVCLLQGHLVGKKKYIDRFPRRSEDLNEWATSVIKNEQTIKEQTEIFDTFGMLVDTSKTSSPVAKVLSNHPRKDLTLASLKLLANTIRNRDAHRFVQNVREAHFTVVDTLFVPALNILLSYVNQEELRQCEAT